MTPSSFLPPPANQLPYSGRSTYGGRLVTQFEKKFNAMIFQSFLENLLEHVGSRGRLTVILLDNARYHHATLLKPFLQQYRKRLRLEFLPAYSPKLNPIERVWKLTRRLCTHNEYFPNLTALQEAVSDRVSMWEKPNEVLHKLCCIN